MTVAKSPHWLEQLKASRVRGRLLLCSPLARIALSTSARGLILADVRKWCEYSSLPSPPEGAVTLTAAYIAESRAFRTLIYYRLRQCESTPVTLMMPVLRAIWRPHPTLILHPDSLGPGCFILHGDATMVGARSIGENFIVGQHVVVGYRGQGELPTIGDDVTIYVGAIVIGDIKIGDGATVGAGAVVANNVPNGTTVVGLPARPVPLPLH
jgi:serine O-acetyltransferase